MSEVATTPLASFIERAARDESFDVQKFEAMLRLQREERHEQERRAFNVAMSACQAQMEPVIRNAVNSHTSSKYAKLEAIDQQMRPIYTKHGFSVRYGSAVAPQPGWMRITCTVAHDAGYDEESYLDAPVTSAGSQGGRTAMTGVQAVGSAVTYLRRYLLGMVFNIVQADVAGQDDDGHAAGTYVPPEGSYRAPKRPPPPNPQRPTEAWQSWLLKLRLALSGKDKDEIAEICGRQTVIDAIEHGPEWVQRDTKAIMAEAHEAAMTNSAADDLPFPGVDPPDLEIPGEDKLAAG